MSTEIHFRPNTLKSNALTGSVTIIIHPITVRHLDVNHYALLYNAMTTQRP